MQATNDAKRRDRVAFDDTATATWVYAARTPEGFIKIGRAKDPWARLHIYQTIFVGRVEMVAVWPSELETEGGAHAALKAHHIRGELFEDVSSVVDYARGLMMRCSRGEGLIRSGNRHHERKRQRTIAMGRPHAGGWDGRRPPSRPDGADAP